MAWHRLPPKQTKRTIKTIGGQVLYGAKKCKFPFTGQIQRDEPPLPATLDH